MTDEVLKIELNIRHLIHRYRGPLDVCVANSTVACDQLPPLGKANADRASKRKLYIGFFYLLNKLLNKK